VSGRGSRMCCTVGWVVEAVGWVILPHPGMSGGWILELQNCGGSPLPPHTHPPLLSRWH